MSTLASVPSGTRSSSLLEAVFGTSDRIAMFWSTRPMESESTNGALHVHQWTSRQIDCTLIQRGPWLMTSACSWPTTEPFCTKLGPNTSFFSCHGCRVGLALGLRRCGLLDLSQRGKDRLNGLVSFSLLRLCDLHSVQTVQPRSPIVSSQDEHTCRLKSREGRDT